MTYQFSATADATDTEPCPAGSARGDMFFNEGDEKFTKCRQCDWKQGKFQKDTGRAICKKVPDGFFVGK